MRARMLAVAAALVTALTGCSTGTDAVATGGTFEFVSPGGRTDIFYDPPADRGTVGAISGENLTEPGTVSLSDYRGDVVVLNVWGSWCGPCRSEADELVAVAAATEASGVQFLGIDFRDPNRSAGEDFSRDFGLTYPSIYDPPGRTLLALRGVPRSVVPLTVVLDRQHRVAAVFLRELLAQDLQPTVERIAREP